MRSTRIGLTLTVGSAIVAFSSLAPAQAPKAPAAKNAAAPPAAAKQAAPAKTQPKPVDPAKARDLETLLNAWENKSSQIKTLSAVIRRQNVRKNVNETDNFVGQAELKAPDLAYLNFQRLDETTGKPEPLTDRIVCTGKDVWLYVGESKQIFVYPLDPNQQQKALQEGPLPFLFNFKVAEAKARYFLELWDSPKADAYLIHIVPRLPHDQAGFSQALVFLNKKRLLPESIRLFAPNQKQGNYQSYYFADEKLKVNVPVDDGKFKGVRFAGWKLEVNPGANGQQKAQAPAGAAARPAAAPAQGGAIGRNQPAAKPAGRVPR